MRRPVRLPALLLVAVAAALAAPLNPLAAQGQYFGQNHVQFRKFRWQVLKTEHFDVHYYPELEDVAQYTGQMAERTYARLKVVFNHEFRERKPILIYGSRNEFAQNNVIGDPGEGTGGVTDALRQRNMFFFTGDMKESEHVLAHEMVHVFQYDIFGRGRAGGGMQALAQVGPPLWFTEGMAEYLSIGPEHPYTDAIMRDAALNGNIPSVEQMTQRPDQYFPYRFGESFFKYVGARWGDEIIGEIMQAVPSLGIERAFRRYTGTDLEVLGDEWKESVQTAYLPDIPNLERPRKVANALLDERRTGGLIPVYVAPSLSPDGRQIAFISMGSLLRAEVFLDLYLADATTGKRTARLTKSQLDPEFEELRFGYSQGAFSPDGRLFAFTAQRQGRDVIYLHDVRRNRTARRLDTPLVQMLGPSFSPDGRQIVFSGIAGGTSDLYIIDADGKNLRRLTQDPYGDVQPQWSPDGRYIVFASERGPQSDLETLSFGHWQLSIYDLQTGNIEVLPNQDGKSLNPMWSPDGQSIAYVNDRTGIPQIFLYELGDKQHYQLTKFVGGVFSLTEHSPAITWARQADKLAFTYHDDGEFAIWSIVDPRSLKKEPFSPKAAMPVIAEGAGSDSSAAGADSRAGAIARIAEIARAVGDSGAQRLNTQRVTPERRRAVYLGADGWRPSAVAPAVAARGVSVAALLDSAELALPSVSDFTTERYRAKLSPEYVATPSVGYSQDNFGRGVYGATGIVLSDMVGNRRLMIAGGINGRLSEAQLFLQYNDLGSRNQWGIGLQHYPMFFLSGFQQLQQGSVIVQQQVLSRFIVRSAFAMGQYPLNRFTRFEYGSSFNNIDRSLMYISAAYDAFSGTGGGYLVDSIVGQGSLNYFSPFVAFVSDNALMGATGGIYGRRYRFQLEQTTGSVRWTTYSADIRRYDAILFNFLTFATRLAAHVSVGPDEDEFPKYIGRPDFIRGYDRETYGADCEASISDPTQCSAVQLLGSRVAYANAELRFPLLRRVDLGILPISLPPVDGLFFYDFGMAWTAGQKLHLARPSNYDFLSDRYPLRSYGFGIRLNLFGVALVRWDYSIPLDGVRRDGYWFWTLGQSF
ncbi:MAG: PD40 domain-containing protein [Gemmatimonadaceae bacterium]|nr:PD40 domain-containing protein [Gemmatimonadaceae bacterium]